MAGCAARQAQQCGQPKQNTLCDLATPGSEHTHSRQQRAQLPPRLHTICIGHNLPALGSGPPCGCCCCRGGPTLQRAPLPAVTAAGKGGEREIIWGKSNRGRVRRGRWLKRPTSFGHDEQSGRWLCAMQQRRALGQFTLACTRCRLGSPLLILSLSVYFSRRAWRRIALMQPKSWHLRGMGPTEATGERGLHSATHALYIATVRSLRQGKG